MSDSEVGPLLSLNRLLINLTEQIQWLCVLSWANRTLQTGRVDASEARSIDTTRTVVDIVSSTSPIGWYCEDAYSKYTQSTCLQDAVTYNRSVVLYRFFAWMCLVTRLKVKSTKSRHLCRLHITPTDVNCLATDFNKAHTLLAPVDHSDGLSMAAKQRILWMKENMPQWSGFMTNKLQRQYSSHFSWLL